MVKRFYLTKEAGASAIKLYKFLVSVPLEDEILGNQLRVHVHRVLVGILTSLPPTQVRAGGLVDLTLALRAYKGPQNGFGPTTIASACCAMLQYGMRSIVVHISRLGGGKADYEKIKEPTNGQISDDICTNQEKRMNAEGNIPALEECDPTDLNEEEVDALLESEIEHEVQLASQTRSAEIAASSLAYENTGDIGNEKIPDPFLDFENGDDSEEGLEAPDLTKVEDDALLT